MIRLTKTALFILVPLFLALYASPAKAQTKVYRYTHIGNLNFHANNPYKAAQYYLKVLKKDASNSRAMFNLANVYLTKGDIKAADSLYNRVAQTDPNKQVRAMAWHNRGYISQSAASKSRDQQQQLLLNAIEQYKQSLRLNPHDERTRYNLALCQKQLKNNPQQNKPQNKQQKQKKQQEQDKRQNNNQKQQQEQNQQDKQQEQQQTQQYINLAKQAEKRALEKLKQHQPKQRAKGKNW